VIAAGTATAALGAPVDSTLAGRAGVRLVSLPYRDRGHVLFASYPHLLVSVPSSWDGTWRIDLPRMTPGREEVVFVSDTLRAAVRVVYQPYDLGLVVPSRKSPGAAPDSLEIARRILSRMKSELRRQRGDLIFTDLPPETLGGRIFRGWMADVDSSRLGAPGRGGPSAAPESTSFGGYDAVAATPDSGIRPAAGTAADPGVETGSRPGWIRAQVAFARETHGYYAFILALRERHPRALRRILKLEEWLAATLLESLPAGAAASPAPGRAR
jgi:hypothetical protein